MVKEPENYESVDVELLRKLVLSIPNDIDSLTGKKIKALQLMRKADAEASRKFSKAYLTCRATENVTAVDAKHMATGNDDVFAAQMFAVAKEADYRGYSDMIENLDRKYTAAKKVLDSLLKEKV